MANTGEQNGAVLILLGEGRFAGIILKHSKSADLLCKSLLSYVWRVPSSKVLSCKHERLFDLLPLISKYSKKRPGLIAQGENVFRGTTCIQSLALHFVSTDILCSCNVELTLKPTWHVYPDLWTGYAVWFTARGLLLQFVHESSHRPLPLCASRGCVLLPVMAFG